MEEIIRTKKCRTCNETKPITEFSPAGNTLDGYSKDCKKCCEEKRLSKSKILVENPLSNYTPRQLMDELKRRGYSGDLIFTQKVKF